jgi:hypothetical protein
MKKSKRSFLGLKLIIVLLTFLSTIYFAFSGANHVILYISSGFENHDARLVCAIVLWFVSFWVVVAIALGLASALTRIVMIILNID